MSSAETIKDFTTLKKNLKKDFGGLSSVKIALLGDSATQLLSQAIRSYGYEAGVAINLFEADYNQVERQVFDGTSELYEFGPEFVMIYQSSQKLHAKFGKADKASKTSFAEEQINEVKNYYTTLTTKLKTKLIYLNFIEINDGVFGNYSNKTELSFLYQLRKLNFGLMDLARECKDLFICDTQLLGATLGCNTVFDPKMYYTADMTLSIDVLPHVAKNIADIVTSANGKFKKCLILDLDNTVWGGIIGDDGLENIEIGDLGLGKAFTEFQLWVKQLRERGIIIAVCSKNDESIAKEPFEKHPDMVLRLDDIAVFVANWNNKADNISYIQQVLNIGFDSMVFIDDNPFERGMIRANLPLVTVPELPEDPAQYLAYLTQLNLFETASFSEEDEMRTQHYQEEAGRLVARKSFASEDDFLKSLNMTSEVQSFNPFNLPRVAQLSQRSNQFNLRTVRYSEENVQELAASKDYFTLTYTLTDKFGDNGLICMVILKKEAKSLFIENWLMSCRVLKRGMENFTLNTIVALARKNGFDKIMGEYLPTAKNGMVKDHYEKLGFSHSGTRWELSVKEYEDRRCFIKQN